MKPDITLWVEKDENNPLGKTRSLEIISLLNEMKIPFIEGVVDEELKKSVVTLSSPPVLQILTKRGGSEWIGYDRARGYIKNFDYRNN